MCALATDPHLLSEQPELRCSAILVANIDESYRRMLLDLVAGTPLRILELPDAETAPANVGLVLLGANGDLDRCCRRVQSLRRRVNDAPLVVLAQSLGVDAAVHLMRAGAADVIEAPVPAGRLRSQLLTHLKSREDETELDCGILGKSFEMRRLRKAVTSVAKLNCTVLLTGETGTGKGLAARAIHCLSSRSDQPFVHVDCTALLSTVIESELFGHERGAFTGAVSRRTGRFELASSGTIFLDEIGDMDPRLQAKLLRVLHDREYERIGGTTTLPMTARVIAATNRNLRLAMREGSFRPDLYFRLQVYEQEIPPLRTRPEDIPELVRAGVARLCRQLGLSAPTITRSFLDRLMEYSWPGNVRELFNFLERCLVQVGNTALEARHFDLCDEDRDAEQPPAPAFEPAAAAPSDDEGSEKEVIVATLIATGGNVSRAARRLKLPRSTLRYRIQHHNLGDLIPAD